MSCTIKHIEVLGAGYQRLPVRDQAFAESLLNTFHRQGSVSPKQAHWVQVLAERLSQPAPQAVDVGGFDKLIAFFAAAAAKRSKLPKIVLLLEGQNSDDENILIKLVLSGPASQFPGAISVSQVGEYGSAPWYGRIHTNGKFIASRQATPDGLIELLIAFATDPARIAAWHGQKTGCCCFCAAELTDPRSKHVGYGPDCAKSHGLAWGEKPKVAESEPVPFAPAAEPAGWPVALEAPKAPLSRNTPRAASLVALAAKLVEGR